MCISTLLDIAKLLFEVVIPMKISIANSRYVRLFTFSNLMSVMYYFIIRNKQKKIEKNTRKLF